MQEIDVTAIGNAIVDVLAHADDAFLDEHSLTKGSMALIDENQAHALYERMGQAVECSGGSAGNTAAGLAGLGARTAYVGKVKNDQLGEVFAHDIRAVGVDFDTLPAKDGPATARCLILVTPDAQRTMNTYLGACRELGPNDLDAERIRRSKVTYMEGYLWDPPGAKQAFLEASRIAEAAGRKTSLSLSDPFCVERHREDFLDLVEHHVDLLFANEEEICSLYQVPDIEQAAAAVRGHCELAILTRSEKGALVLNGEQSFEVAAEPIERLVDTTGAGDLFAAGFLYGYTQGRPPAEAARIGAICAAEVIGHFGARPDADLAALVAQRLG
ncbi:MAG: adenosine kinase [Myxococcales bacterium]|nr:adenosine kinase [Myxococcales bacterium]